MLTLLLLMLVALAAMVASQAPTPHIVFILTDDLGFNAPGYVNSDLITPTLDSLANAGLKLNQHYTYKYCSPTRGSFLTGRYPFKLSATRGNLPGDIPDGIYLNFTMIPKKLQQANYVSHHVGKWHQGFFAPEYLAFNRGFNSSFGYLEAAEDHFTSSVGSGCIKPYDVDLFNNSAPAFHKNGTYTAFQFNDAAVSIIQNHDPSQPLFLYLPLHNCHAPIEAPQEYIDLYHFNQTLRNTFDAMVSVVDSTVKNVTDALRAAGLWDNTLLVWTTDNGTPVTVAGSNAPLRGGKMSNWEGGIHVPGFVSGGFLPQNMSGKTLEGQIHICDWYSTFCNLAGVDPADPSGPSPIDSIDMWPYISGQVSVSPRNNTVYDHLLFNASNPTGALRMGDYKLIVGGAEGEDQASWYGQFTPNTSQPVDTKYATCFTEHPCVFNIAEDPTEHNDISKTHPNITSMLVNWFNELKSEYHPPVDAPPKDEKGYCDEVFATRGYVGPWRTNPYIPG